MNRLKQNEKCGFLLKYCFIYLRFDIVFCIYDIQYAFVFLGE